MTTQIIIAFTFGVVFLIGLIVIAIVFPRPTPFQYNVFRVVLALAAAGAAAMMPGFINLEVTAATSLLIRAVGALAVFVAVFFFNPAQLAVQNESQEQLKLPKQAESQNSFKRITQEAFQRNEPEEAIQRSTTFPPSVSNSATMQTSQAGSSLKVNDSETVGILYEDEQITVSIIRSRITGELSVLKEYPGEYFRPLQQLFLEHPGIILPDTP